MANWPAEIVSEEQVRQVLGELEHLKAWAGQEARAVQVGAVTRAPKPVIGAQTRLFIGKADPFKLADGQIDKLVNQIESQLSSSPKVHVTLPEFPADEVKFDIANWFRNNTSPDVLVGFHSDTTLGGGMILRTRNRLYNFSLRRTLWQERHRIPEIVRRA